MALGAGGAVGGGGGNFLNGSGSHRSRGKLSKCALCAVGPTKADKDCQLSTPNRRRATEIYM